MIFAVSGHIEMIRNGIYDIHIDEKGNPMFPIKTQSRRLNRSIYKVGKDYAVQRRYGVKAESDIRIVMDRIWEEEESYISGDGDEYPLELIISEADAQAEGGYKPAEFERLFRDLNSEWDGFKRWVFEFHPVKIEELKRR